MLSLAEIQQLDDFGFVSLPNFFPELLEPLKIRIDAIFADEGNRAGSEFKQEPGCRRLANLVDKGDIFQQVIAHSRLLPYIRHVLGDEIKLSSLNVRSVDPHWTKSQPLHADMRHKATGNNRTRPVFAFALCAMLFAFCPSAPAQQPKKVPRIGYLSASSLAALANRTEAFRRGLSDLGYVEGKNIVIEYRYGDGQLDRVPALAAELARLKVDMIVIAGGNATVSGAKQAIESVPIIMDENLFKRRTKQLVLRVIKTVESLPKNRTADVLGRQLI